MDILINFLENLSYIGYVLTSLQTSLHPHYNLTTCLKTSLHLASVVRFCVRFRYPTGGGGGCFMGGYAHIWGVTIRTSLPHYKNENILVP